MRWYLRRGNKGVVHAAFKEGGGTIAIMMTACGVHVRWDKPHEPWVRAEWQPSNGPYRSNVTCRKCAR